MSKSASACPLTTAARWKIESAPEAKDLLDEGCIRDIAHHRPRTRASARLHGRDGIVDDALALLPMARGDAAAVGEEPRARKRAGEARAQEARAAGDDDAHRDLSLPTLRASRHAMIARDARRGLPPARWFRVPPTERIGLSAPPPPHPGSSSLALRKSALSLCHAEYIRARTAGPLSAMRHRASRHHDAGRPDHRSAPLRISAARDCSSARSRTR